MKLNVIRLISVLWFVIGANFGFPQMAFAQTSCPPQQWDKAALLELRDKQFQLAESISPSAFAKALVPCLRSLDPELRDQIAYEGLSSLMRSNQIDIATALSLFAELIGWLDSEVADDNGVGKPFAILVLAELARMDRLESYLSNDQRQQLIMVTRSYLRSLDDYRGFDANEGWRHGVAHAADLVLQLALNPEISTDQLQQLADSLGLQILPTKEHFYRYGEPQRIARAVFYITQREQIEGDWWQWWFARLSDSAKSFHGSPIDLFHSNNGLARRHNLMAFYMALYVYVNENGSTTTKEQLLPLLRQGIVALS